jgi:hypothetical protein
MIGHGYGSCKSCHIDSSGGGPLTPYGRTISEEILSTWSREREGETFYGLIDVSPLGLHGDFRFLSYRYQDAETVVEAYFPMQREVSLSFDPSKNVSFIASSGLYGPDATEYEYRRYYGKVTLGYGLGIRAGRFMPAFGLMIPDHTKATRELFSQGKESLNLEVSWTTKYLELFLTRIAGSQSGIETSATPVVNQRDDRNGYALKLSVNLHRGFQVGGSYANLTDDATAVRGYGSFHAFLGNKNVFAYGEYQSWPEGDEKIYGTVGIAPAKGLWMKFEMNKPGKADDPTFFGTVQWFPRPHYEFLLSYSVREIFFIAHTYL